MERFTTRQNEIIAAALGIINECGLEALTMKNIATRIGFSDAAVYRHFKSKSHILRAMVEHFAESSLHELNVTSIRAGSGLHQIKWFFFDRCRTFAADRALATVMFAENMFKSDPALAAEIHDIMQDHRRLLLKSIRLGQRQGDIKNLPAAHLFTLVMGSLRLLVLQWQVGNCAFELPAAGDKLWHSLETLIANKKGDLHEKKNHSN
jgi:AcrR family transcriptional regulator